MEKVIKETHDLTENLLSLMGIEADIEVKEAASVDEEKAVEVVIKSKDESGLLIGAHGQTLNAIQSFLSLALRNKVGEWVRILVDIGDFREKQKENLVALGKQAAQRALQTGQPQYLYNLTPAQRREIHLSLKEDKDVETESQGEGAERYLVIKPRG